MRRASTLAGLLLVAVTGMSACGTSPGALPASTSAPVPSTAPPATTDSSTTVAGASTTTPAVLPITTVPAPCGGLMVTTYPTTRSLEPLLLTGTDVPAGYTTTGPQPSADTTVFGGSLATSVPVATITYAMGSGPAGPFLSIDEALAREPTARAASDEAHQRQTIDALCGDGGTTVALPGPVPGLVATTLLGGQRGEDITSAQVDASAGLYVLEINWINTLDIYNTGVTGPQPALPTPTVMASVVDAALARLPR